PRPVSAPTSSLTWGRAPAAPSSPTSSRYTPPASRKTTLTSPPSSPDAVCLIAFATVSLATVTMSSSTGSSRRERARTASRTKPRAHPTDRSTPGNVTSPITAPSRASPKSPPPRRRERAAPRPASPAPADRNASSTPTETAPFGSGKSPVTPAVRPGTVFRSGSGGRFPRSQRRSHAKRRYRTPAAAGRFTDRRRRLAYSECGEHDTVCRSRDRESVCDHGAEGGRQTVAGPPDVLGPGTRDRDHRRNVGGDPAPAVRPAPAARPGLHAEQGPADLGAHRLARRV